MKKLMKKNQIIITVLAVMIAVAGYLSFTSKEVSIIDEDGNPVELTGADVQETLQESDDSNLAETMNTEVIEGSEDESVVGQIEGADGNSDDAQVSAPVNDSIGEAVLTNAGVVDAIVNAKLNREQVRSKSQEVLMEIVNNESIDQESKQTAVDELVAMTEVMEKESVCEQQLMAKGFDECVVLISDDCVDVTVNRSELSEVEKAQIEDIVTRKTGCDVSQVVITVIPNE